MLKRPLEDDLGENAGRQGSPYPDGEDSKAGAKRGIRAKFYPMQQARRSAPDGEGGPTGPPMMTYREGVPLTDLARFLRADGTALPVEVRINAQWLSNFNRQVQTRSLWGSDIYTQDSDLVAVLMHMGYYSHTLAQAPPMVSHIIAVVLPLKPLPQYQTSARNGIRSRCWGAACEGCSYKVTKCWLVTTSGQEVPLESSNAYNGSVQPTILPRAFDRALNTRSASSLERRQRTMQEVTIQYNLCNEPWLKYSMGAVADGGLKPSQLTSARLHSEVLYLETQWARYELSRVGAPADTGDSSEEVFRWAKCRKPLTLHQALKAGMPLPDSHVEIQEEKLDWEDIKWGALGMTVKGKPFIIVRLHFMKRSKPTGTA